MKKETREKNPKNLEKILFRVLQYTLNSTPEKNSRGHFVVERFTRAILQKERLTTRETESLRVRNNEHDVFFLLRNNTRRVV